MSSEGRNQEEIVKSQEYTVSVSMTRKEKRLIESLSRRSKVADGEMIRILLFETGILQNRGT